MGDSWGVKIDNQNGIIDLSSAIPGVVFIDNGEIKKIIGGRSNVEYTLISESPIKFISGVNVKNGSGLQPQAKVITLLNIGDLYIVK
ncbi:hypothetical protein [Raoultella planticola]|uniref:hypothetical protein n=1 Tax=Raoultella planticola TaxID=575 RepID=UPI001185D6AA|nr:hypothetical protein [Raoultella planticola]